MSKIPCFSSTTLKILDRVKFCGLKFPHLCNEELQLDYLDLSDSIAWKHNGLQIVF